ncbi:MAG: peptidase prolyl oligopeptidase active site domain protein [Acidimicrobiales bacterium]|nr:peptidase prolyl oligopeptidase active site domain protein [Acidimicrobiales bacterium]
MEDWERRFRAPQIGFPSWARDAPDRLAVATDEGGSWQVHAWDRASGHRGAVSDEPIGVMGGDLTPDGEGVVWFHDVTGDERGHWLVAPFDADADAGTATPGKLLDGVPDGWSEGLALGRDVVALGVADGEGFDVWIARRAAAPIRVHRHVEYLHVGPLSRDETLVAYGHAEHGDVVHLAVRVIDSRTAETVGEQWDGRGLGLTPVAFSPVTGDPRLVLQHERSGLERPAMWNVATNERVDLEVGLPGDVTVAGWYPDAGALLLVHGYEGRDQLHRLDLADGALVALTHPPGTLAGAGVRPDGDVWYRLSSGAVPPAVRSLATGADVVAPVGQPAPGGRPYESWWFTNPNGDRVHGFFVEPDRPGPHPVVMLVHGGPTWAYTDMFQPDVQAFVDRGFAVGVVNYRGSTGYGVRWRDSLLGNPGFPECEDVAAGLDDLVARRVADPARAVLAGRSWGGYVTLLGLGLQPDRWALGLAGVPVADYPAAYEDEAPGLQAYDRSLFGGSPEELPDLYRERSPLTYVDRVRAPVFIWAGDNDSRCPIRQILNYVDALRERGRDVELYRYDAGHGAMVVEEKVAQMRRQLDFLDRGLQQGR